MDLTLEQYRKVQAYLDERMSSEEATAFMQEVREDNTLQEYLQFEIELRENLVALKGVEIPAIAVSIVEPSLNSKKSKTITWRTTLAIAAGLVLAAAGIYWLSGGVSQRPDMAKRNSAPVRVDTVIAKTSPDTLGANPPHDKINFAALFARYYTREPVHEKPDQLYLALNDFENKKYKTIQDVDLSEFSSGLRGPLSDDEIQHLEELGHFYKGISFIETNDNTKAVANLSWIIANSKSKTLQQKAIWYLSLIFIRQGEINKAIENLTVLSNSRSAYNAQAKTLLQALTRS